MVTQPFASSSAALPPGWRDLEIYRLVKVDHCSTRQAAQRLRLSQTRICQIIERVGGFLGELLLQTNNAADRQRDLLLAEQIAAERMEGLYRQSMQAFQRSQVQTVSVYEGDGEDSPPQITKRTSGGDSRYLLAAARLALHSTKLPMPKLDGLLAVVDDCEDESLEETDDDDQDFDQELADQLADLTEELTTNPEADFSPPPAEDCSLAREPEPVAPMSPRASSAAAADLETTCVDGVSLALISKLNSAAPVQPAAANPKQPGAALDTKHSPSSLPNRKQRARQAFFGE